MTVHTALASVLFAGMVFGSALASVEQVAVEDEVVVVFNAGYVNDSVLDAISSEANCIGYRRYGKRIAVFRLAENSLQAQAIEDIQALGLAEIRSIQGAFEYRLGPDLGAADKSAPAGYIDPPDVLQPHLSFPEGAIPPIPDPPDPAFYKQWYLSSLTTDVVGAWQTTRGGTSYAGGDSSVALIVLDSGMDLDHAEFYGEISAGRIDTVSFAAGLDDIGGINPVEDYYGHGTRMLGIAAAGIGNGGVAGVAPDVKVVVGDISYYTDQFGYATTSPYVWLNALEYVADFAANDPARRVVVNVSYDMGFTPFGSGIDAELWDLYEDVMLDCLQYHNVLFVAAAGNDNSACSPGYWEFPGRVAYPAMFSGINNGYGVEALDRIVVAVGGVTYGRNFETSPYVLKAYDKTSWSAWAADDTCDVVVDVCAPTGGPIYECAGEDVFGLYTSSNDGSYDYSIGTSGASAIVSGISCLVWAANPSLTADEVKYLLRAHANDMAAGSDHGTRYLGSADPFNGSWPAEGPWRWGMNRNRGFGARWLVGCPAPKLEGFGFPVKEPVLKAGVSYYNYDYMSSQVFGSGIPDARSCVRFAEIRNFARIWGGVVDSAYVIPDLEAVRLSSDLRIVDGGVLRIAHRDSIRMTRVRVVPYDGTGNGDYPDLVEIVVEDGGRLEIGSGGAIFEPYYESNYNGPDWAGIRVEPGGVIEVVDGNGELYIGDALIGLDMAGDVDGLGWVRIADCDTGLRLQADAIIDTLTIVNADSVGLDISGASLQVAGRLVVTAEDIGKDKVMEGVGIKGSGNFSILAGDSTIVEGFEAGLLVGAAQDSGSVSSSELMFDGAKVGIRTAGQLSISEAAVVDVDSVGIWCMGGAIDCSGGLSVVADSCAVGLLVQSDNIISAQNGIDIGECELGILVDSSASVAVGFGDVFVHDCVDGIVAMGNVGCRSIEFENICGTSIELYDSSITANGDLFVSDAGCVTLFGIVANGESAIVVTDSVAVYGASWAVVTNTPSSSLSFFGGGAFRNCVLGGWLAGNIAFYNGCYVFQGSGSGPGLVLGDADISVGSTAELEIVNYDHGISVPGEGTSFISGPITIRDCNIYGVDIAARMACTLEGLRIFDCAQDCIRASDVAALVVDGDSLGTDSALCLNLLGETSAVVSNSDIVGTGVFVGPGATLNAGDRVGQCLAGGNSFQWSAKGNNLFFISNLDTTSTALADGNTWQAGGVMTCPPETNTNWGDVRTVCGDCD